MQTVLLVRASSYSIVDFVHFHFKRSLISALMLNIDTFLPCFHSKPNTIPCLDIVCLAIREIGKYIKD